MVSPDCQTKLQAEIDEMNKKVNGKPVNYNQIQGMKYMDQIVCETLRKWPSPVIDRFWQLTQKFNLRIETLNEYFRACNKDFEMEYDGKKIVIEKGRSFYISVAGLHYDERYYENPDKFDPERFNEENRGKIDPGTYLPFGEFLLWENLYQYLNWEKNQSLHWNLFNIIRNRPEKLHWF